MDFCETASPRFVEMMITPSPPREQSDLDDFWLYEVNDVGKKGGFSQNILLFFFCHTSLADNFENQFNF